MMYRKDRLTGQKKHLIILAFMATASLAVIIIPFTESKFHSLAARAPLGTVAKSAGGSAAHPAPIVSISVCSANGAGGAGSCSNGLDTYQNVLAPAGTTCTHPLANGRCSINSYAALSTLADEHSTVFPPGALQSNSDYLLFVAARTNLNQDSSGLVALTAGPGPDANGQWTFDFASGYGNYPSASPSPSPQFGQLFLSPVNHHLCPTVADKNPAHQDQTFDLNYADPGSVVIDPTNPSNSGPGSLLMIYEGTTRCIGLTGGNNVQANNSFYSSVAVATSNDYGHSWPSYRYLLDQNGNPQVPLPFQNPGPSPSPVVGPQAPSGARGNSVCIGNDCSAPPWPPNANYGRYSVLRPQKSIGDVMANPATSSGLTNQLGDSEPSAFVDDASANPAQYIYELHNYAPGDPSLNNPPILPPLNLNSDLMIARAQLNGGTTPLTFMKWNGQAFSESGLGGLETPIFPVGSPAKCEGSGQLREMGSVSYVEESQQYLLTFVCSAPSDPKTGSAGPGAAWFYSTSYDLSDQTQWSSPQEIDGSWSAFDAQSQNCSDYNGWYPTYMSLNRKPGHLSTSGYVFYMHGCLGDLTPGGRQFSTRAFTITTATPTPTPTPTPKTIQFSSSGFSVNEGAGDALVSVTRGGDPAASATVDYATSDTAGANSCNVTNGAASSRCDYLTTIGTLHFAANETSKTISIPIVDDSYAEGNETFTITLSNPSGATLGLPATATITIVDNDSVNGVNPIDTAGFFVRQHYIDFLNREPDTSGLNFWTNEITSCGSNQSCVDVKRVNVSAAFFISIEFQQTGYLVYRIYKSAYGNLSGAPVPVILNEFLPDTQEIGQGVIVNQGNWQQQLENNKQAFTLEFVQRSRFTSAYATSLTPAQFVAMMFANAGVTPSSADRTTAINEFGGATTTADVAARSRALRDVAENSTLNQQEFNRAFVLMQYFGYLRRNPYDAPEPTLDYQGYNFWLNKLNSFGGNYINAEMVKAFITSSEYRQRFGP